MLNKYGWMETRKPGEKNYSRTQRDAGLVEQGETEIQIEKVKPLRDPTSHKPKKKDDISLENVIRHRERYSRPGSVDRDGLCDGIKKAANARNGIQSGARDGKKEAVES